MIGLLRVKNEARWIERSIRSIQPICESILVMDDHSTDGTPEICSAIPGVRVFHSPFEGLNECRDKNWLLERFADVCKGDAWVLMIDGDEVLHSSGVEILRAACDRTDCDVFSLRVLYLWNSEAAVRTDGVYGRFRRPSMFRPRNHRFVPSAAAAGFHCGNVPLSLQASARPLESALLHFGYMDQADRVRKYHWYRAIDGSNRNEDGYRHMVQGDLPEIPATARLRHAGPLFLRPLEGVI